MRAESLVASSSGSSAAAGAAATAAAAAAAAVLPATAAGGGRAQRVTGGVRHAPAPCYLHSTSENIPVLQTRCTELLALSLTRESRPSIAQTVAVDPTQRPPSLYLVGLSVSSRPAQLSPPYHSSLHPPLASALPQLNRGVPLMLPALAASAMP
ncbi:hypothetical protein B0J12DRAFT_316013 [Macrophomina phaseolina]|uniref:Uncharacterized protein n=1 Tax=Macrophomina phaseolina TaxID=35725 RepID=A0ABQ8FZA8_9PEZI|nr:hypothetical protein B0J12DRAFT_316013 [Macrophomina phaseolina]